MTNTNTNIGAQFETNIDIDTQVRAGVKLVRLGAVLPIENDFETELIVAELLEELGVESRDTSADKAFRIVETANYAEGSIVLFPVTHLNLMETASGRVLSLVMCEDNEDIGNPEGVYAYTYNLDNPVKSEFKRVYFKLLNGAYRRVA